MLRKLRTATYLFPISFILITFVCFGLKTFQGIAFHGVFVTGSIYDLLFNIPNVDILLMIFVILNITTLVFGVVIFAISFIKRPNVMAKVIDIMALTNAGLILLNIILSLFLKNTIRMTNSLLVTNNIYITDIFLGLAIISYVISLFVPRMFYKTRISNSKLIINSYLIIALLLDIGLIILCATNYFDFNLSDFITLFDSNDAYFEFILPIALAVFFKGLCLYGFNADSSKFFWINYATISSIGAYFMMAIDVGFISDGKFVDNIIPNTMPFGFGEAMLIAIPIALGIIHAIVFVYAHKVLKHKQQSIEEINLEYINDNTAQYNLIGNIKYKIIKRKNKQEAEKISKETKGKNKEEKVSDKTANKKQKAQKEFHHIELDKTDPGNLTRREKRRKTYALLKISSAEAEINNINTRLTTQYPSKKERRALLKVKARTIDEYTRYCKIFNNINARAKKRR